MRRTAPANRRRVRVPAAAMAIATVIAAALAASASGATPVDAPFPRWGPSASFTDPIATPAAIRRRRWLDNVVLTQYWPAPEKWFVGRKLRAPGIDHPVRIDWLYSARGVSMEGDGIGLDGKRYHIDDLGRAGWVTLEGRGTSPGRSWAGGPPFWRNARFWRNRSGHVTFPLEDGGWYRGRGREYVPNKGISFAEGPSRDIAYWRSIAVDPSMIPLGSRVYIPAYRDEENEGWFVAEDVGGGIIGRHIDVFVPPPSSRFTTGTTLQRQRVLVEPPGTR